MTVAIVGPGAVGASVAAALHDAGEPVLLCGRRPLPGIEVRRDGHGPVLVPGPVHTDPQTLSGPADLVFLAVKATQNAAATPWLRALCAPGTVVCVLQNGVEQVASVAPLAGAATVVPAGVWFPAEVHADGWVWLRGELRLSLPDDPAARVVADALGPTWCSVQLSADFVTEAWHKLLVNAVSGFMVLTGRRMGSFRRADVASLAEAYLAECLAVARCEGAALPDDLPARTVRNFQSMPDDLGTSILTDRQAGRPLEWQERNGVILRRAKAHGLPAPISEVIVPLLAAASDGPG